MSLGIPYMGSKRKLSGDILNTIVSRHPLVTDFYDLFGGGGAISFRAIKDYRFNVYYNELNPHIFKLIEYLKNKKALESKFYEWVTREEFFKQLARSDAEADWYSGFVMSCWSFGNKQSSYIYGEDIEEMKRLAHQFVVFGDLDAMRSLKIDLPELLTIRDVQKRRIYFCNYIQKVNRERFVQLERIQNLQNLQNLQITNLSYEQVKITGMFPVIYCDIPYRGTGEYKQDAFDYDKFYQWVAGMGCPIYISEYNAPFLEVDAFAHRSSLSATNNKKKTVEKIFWNGIGQITKTKLFV